VTGAKVGRGKVLTPPLDRSGVISLPDTVRRHIKPPPIRGPPEIHAYTDTEDEDEDDEEEDEEPTDIAALRAQLASLRLRLNNMDEQVAETEIDRMELGDRVDTLRKAVCSKIKRLAKATRNEDLYRSLDPK
jgi:predicted RNase H-like nuclease (RuvC/YqgF family)